MSSDESEDSLELGEDAAVPSGEDRLRWPVGGRVDLPLFSGKCLGDDVSWRPREALRVVALQTAGTGVDRYVWGRHWASCLADLGADVGILSETRIATSAGHAAASRGLADGGYCSLSHNVPPSASDFPGRCDPRSGGVVLAMRAQASTGWHSVARDLHGRAVAGTVSVSAGLEIRFVAVYGVTGSCLPGFERLPYQLQQEAALANFILDQEAEALQHNWPLIVAGDVNSICSTDLDVWEVQAQPRAGSICSLLHRCGLTDSFRARHPRLQAFTYFTSSGASRLDAIWWRSPQGRELHLLNAAVVWQWPRHIDHDPVIADFACVLQEAPDVARVETWQRLLAMTDDAQLPRQRAATAARVEPLRAEILAIQTQLEEISVSCGRAVTGAAQAGCPDEHYLSGLFPWSPMHDPRSPALLQRVSQLHGRLMQILQDSLPPTPSQAHSRRHNQVSLAWDTVLNSVRELMQTLRFALLSQPWRPPAGLYLTLFDSRTLLSSNTPGLSGRRSAILRSRSQTGMALNLHLRPGRSLGVFHWKTAFSNLAASTQRMSCLPCHCLALSQYASLVSTHEAPPPRRVKWSPALSTK